MVDSKFIYTLNTNLSGGGVALINSGGMIVHNIIEQNHPSLLSSVEMDIYGGGLYALVNDNHTAIIRHNHIADNTVSGMFAFGGGAFLVGGRIIFEDNTLFKNILQGNGVVVGAGLFWADWGNAGVIKEVIIRNNIIAENRGLDEANSGGGAVLLAGDMGEPVQFYNNVIANNYVDGDAGGLYLFENRAEIFNNTILNNESSKGGNSVFVEGESDNIMYNNIIWSDADNGNPDFFFSIIRNYSLKVYHNLLKEPFNPVDHVEAGNNSYCKPVFQSGSYEVIENCAAVGRGFESLEIGTKIYHAAGVDVLGNDRPNGIDPYVDMGAYESGFSRALLSTANLVKLSFPGCKLSPEFSRETLEYVLGVPDTLSSVAGFDCVPEDWLAETAFEHATNIFSENKADRITTIKVISSDGTFEKNYGVEFNPLSVDATLSALSVSQGTMVPDFDPEILTYDVVLPLGSTKVPSVSYVTSNEHATVEVKDALDLAHTTAAYRTSNVMVTSEFGDPRLIYRLVFTLGTDIQPFEKTGLSIYPNPTDDLISIETSVAGRYQLEISSLNGQEIYSGEMEGSTHQIDLSSFQKGAYFITISSKDFVTTRKIIKL